MRCDINVFGGSDTTPIIVRRLDPHPAVYKTQGTRFRTLASRAPNVTVRSRCKCRLLPSISSLDLQLKLVQADRTNPLKMSEQICCTMAEAEPTFKLDFRLKYRCTVLIRCTVSLPFHSAGLHSSSLFHNLHHQPSSKSISVI